MATTAYIFATTGEYDLNLPLETLKEGIHLNTSEVELDNIYQVEATEENLHKAWDRIQKDILPHMGADDDHYDYIPDVLNQYLHLAYSLNKYEEAKQQLLNNPILSEEYAQDENEDGLEFYLDTPADIRGYIQDFLSNNYQDRGW